MGLKASRVGSTRLREVLISGVPARTRLFSARALPEKSFIFSVIVAKKTTPNAADRNRIRRRCREAFHRCAGSAPSVALVVTARPDAGKAPFPTLVDEAAELLGCYSKK